MASQGVASGCLLEYTATTTSCLGAHSETRRSNSASVTRGTVLQSHLPVRMKLLPRLLPTTYYLSPYSHTYLHGSNCYQLTRVTINRPTVTLTWGQTITRVTINRPTITFTCGQTITRVTINRPTDTFTFPGQTVTRLTINRPTVTFTWGEAITRVTTNRPTVTFT